MSKEPLHPLTQRILGNNVDSDEIEVLEQGLGPLRGPRAILTLVAAILPFVLAGILVGYFQAWGYIALAFVVCFLLIVVRGVSRMKF